ncbi:transcription initiation factor IIB family protein [Haladaptatus cibarius]|uniref:transcription initiation factor IIB family protein n=1 Tax=Haladaptatus cibarius TaxID=453847 RepID=UPI00067902FA|nr:transcription initiation factor IIB family protein [Haladaptatus cibarius]
MKSSGSHTKCPLCELDDTETLQNGVQVCRSCNFVLSQSDQITGSFSLDQRLEESSNGNQDWLDVASVEDSSDSTLVEMIGRTESFVRQLGGNTTDCIWSVEILASAWEHRYFHGRKVEVGIAAAIYVTFREHEKPRPFGVIAEVCGTSPEELRVGYRSLRAELDINGKVVTPVDYITFLASQLSLDEKEEKNAREILESVPDISGNPAGIAVASLYLAAKARDIPLTLVQAGDAAGVTKETVWLKTRDIKNATEIAD